MSNIQKVRKMIKEAILKEMENSVNILNIKRNIMGTVDFDMKKPQEFTVYPMTSGDIDKVAIQSDNRFGFLFFNKNTIVLNSKNKKNANSIAYQMGPRTTYNLDDSQMNLLKSAIKKTAGSNVGSSIVKSDNSGAEKL